MILITNDDGISDGLKVLVQAASELDDVFCIIPSRQRSAVSKSLIFHKPLRLNETEVAGKKAYHLSGTPADCVLFALHKKNFMPQKPRLVLSGINMGSNISLHCIYSSGTLGSCIEAATYGIPAIAFSQHLYSNDWGATKEISEKEEVKQRVKGIIRAVLKQGMPKGCDLLNVNFPEKVKNAQISVCPPSMHRYTPTVLQRTHPYGVDYYWIVGKGHFKGKGGTDSEELRKGKITITPLSISMGSTKNIESARLLFPK